MKMIEAARDTLVRAQAHGMQNLSSDNPDLDFPHLVHMVEQMEAQPDKFSEGKRGRWLGWIQCAVVAAQVGLDLEDMKQINLEHSDQ